MGDDDKPSLVSSRGLNPVMKLSASEPSMLFYDKKLSCQSHVDGEKKGIQNGLYNPVLSVTMMNIVTTESITSFSDKKLS